MKNNNVNTILFFLAIIGLYALVSVGVYALNTLNTHKCHEYQTVSKILEVKYRDVVVLLSNGDVKSVHQGFFKVGDPVCVR